jgi:AraC-like DNA-binding protein
MPIQARQFVESYFDAWNQHDPQGVADHFSKDGIYRDVPENVQRSHDELVTSLYRFFGQFRDRYELISDVLSNGNSVAFQYRIIPTGHSRKNSYQATYSGVEFVTLCDESALLVMDYYDSPGNSRPATVPSPSEFARQQKYAKSGLTDEQLLFYKGELDHIMQSGQVFLRPGLTLPKLADAVGCSVNHLSQVINAGFGVSFFDYVNRYRVEHAKLLLNGLEDQGAVLKVAFAVGFNSNSAFYAAFKKHVGMTPAQFRKMQVSEST